MVKIRYSGDRTGHEVLLIPHIGSVHKGDEIDVPADVAARYLTKREDSHGKMTSDFEEVTAAQPTKTKSVFSEPTPEPPAQAEEPVPPAPVADAPKEDTPKQAEGEP